MKKLVAAVGTLALLTAPLQTGFAAESEQKSEDYLVKFNGPAEQGLLEAFGVEDEDVLHAYELLPVYHINLSENQANGLENHPQVEFVEENAEAEALSQTEPWGVPHVQGNDAQEEGHTGEGVSVAVLDTGIDNTHEDLNVAGGYSVFDDAENSDPYYDANGHGTHVAGTVAALDNDLGVIGVAPETDVYAVKVLDNNGSGSYAGIAEGIEWAIQNDMDIINMSLGGSQSSDILEDYTDLAYDEGSLVVAAAGNDGNRGGNNETVGYPANYESAMAVAAVDENNDRATFSSTGDAVEIAAPGVDVLSTVPGDGYDSFSGTSMAAPHVAGVAAQVWQTKPELTNEELRSLLNDTALDLGPAHQYGHGLVQSLDAIQE
ncbi:S8 family peptidase [Alkalibacillus haloalkaliphilus]|uniref:Subtilisin E n=1 Tax=Alkalibacillus haloalkaliphilus TaxID=94136 RepID=A0A511W5E1_9BACI|nr:S8 family peptidase [Alkalibacillus haloalkaliphilus]GEN46324.1 subtilisin E [Alkalibacillus haloalkaliphilus]